MIDSMNVNKIMKETCFSRGCVYLELKPKKGLDISN